MKSNARFAATALLLTLLACTRCLADGGAVRVLETSGPFRVAAFTSPNPLVAGPVDLSVLVQYAATQEPVEADVELEISRRDGELGTISRTATSRAATNRLFRACVVELVPGIYDVVVKCSRGSQRGLVRFTAEVGPAPPQLLTFWPWIAWPAVPIALFTWHQVWTSRRRRAGSAAHWTPTTMG